MATTHSLGELLAGLDQGSLALVLAAAVATAAALIVTLLTLSGVRVGGGELVDKSVGLRREETNGSTGNLAGLEDKVLNPATFRAFTVVSSKQISHNTKLIRLGLPADRTLGLPIGRHISVRAEVDGNQVIRAYTPTSSSETKGYFELLIKSYEMGKLSPYLHSLKAGSKLDVRGPVGRFRYSKNQHPRIGFVAGGTGLTPCLQVIRCILQGPEGEGDTTQFVLLFQNRTEADILLRAELEELQRSFPSRLQVLFFLSNCGDDKWGNEAGAGAGSAGKPAPFGDAAFSGSGRVQHLRGYVDANAVKTLLGPASCPLVGLCGPSGFNDSVKALLVGAGHDEGAGIYVF